MRLPVAISTAFCRPARLANVALQTYLHPANELFLPLNLRFNRREKFIRSSFVSEERILASPVTFGMRLLTQKRANVQTCKPNPFVPQLLQKSDFYSAYFIFPHGTGTRDTGAPLNNLVSKFPYSNHYFPFSIGHKIACRIVARQWLAIKSKRAIIILA